MSNLKLGDVVRLKSGGPLMTIIDSGNASGTWVCQWFDQNKQTSSSFPSFALISKAELDAEEAAAFATLTNF
ncbi:TPA: DUF2158 domain-containing protein [Aeromonas dhakensis]|nr:DUF2158 domain-containing protein [Aeromonas dhakensis]